MKAKELTEKTDDELRELLAQSRRELFQARVSNYTNQLDNTASIPKSRRTIARVMGELRRRELATLRAGVQAALAQAFAQEGADR